MPINPIDIMRTQEASQLRHIETQRIEHAQEQISRSFQTMVDHQQTKPRETTQADNPEYRYDAKEKGNNEFFGSGSKQRQKKDNKKEKSAAPPKSGGIDILI